MPTIPSEDKRFSQTNKGDTFGNVFATFGMDFTSKEGVGRTSEGMIKGLDTTDEPILDRFIANFNIFDDHIMAVGPSVFNATYVRGTSTLNDWAEDTGSSTPTPSSEKTDSVVWDGYIYVVDGTDIKRVATATGVWSSWWKGTLGKPSLSSTGRKFIGVGPDNDLYIVDGENKVYRVDTDGTVTTSGEGTLDFSAQPYKITCMEFDSSRMYLGFENTVGENGGVIEWDLGPSTISPNYIHPVTAKAVRCIIINNDSPIAVLSDGDFLYHNGSGFVDLPGISFPVGDKVLDEDFIHPNGWDIIDGVPHLLVSGRTAFDGDTLDELENGDWNMPSGVWCLDPNVGLYHRYSLGGGNGTDYGHHYIYRAGALKAIENTNMKFVASYEYMTDNTTEVAIIAHHDRAKTYAGRSWMVTPAYEIDNLSKSIEKLHKKLKSGEEVRIYYRHVLDDSETAECVWSDQSTLHTSDTITADSGLLMVKNGGGAGFISTIDDVSETATLKIIKLNEANTLATTNETCAVEILNFKPVGNITGETLDRHEFTVPSWERNKQIQYLFEYRHAAGNNMEFVNVIIK